jgi:hypothetical protein
MSGLLHVSPIQHWRDAVAADQFFREALWTSQRRDTHFRAERIYRITTYVKPPLLRGCVGAQNPAPREVERAPPLPLIRLRSTQNLRNSRKAVPLYSLTVSGGSCRR